MAERQCQVLRNRLSDKCGFGVCHTFSPLSLLFNCVIIGVGMSFTRIVCHLLVNPVRFYVLGNTASNDLRPGQIQ